VPTPSATKRANACTSTPAPATSSTTPATRNGSHHPGRSVASQPVSHQGTTPATTPGASAKNTALPTAAPALPMGPAY
jgi:hypothetical protein